MAGPWETIKTIESWSPMGSAMVGAAITYAEHPTKQNRAAYLEARRLYDEQQARILADAPRIQEILARRLSEMQEG